jgi:hypothetical protein
VAVARWLATEFPAICAQARREGGMVLWLDEMGVRSDAASGRSWAPVGRTPVIKGTGKRFRVNMISAISNQGLLRFRLFTGSFTGAVFIDFLRRLLRDCQGRKVHLIVDGHPVHRAKLVSAWLGGMASASSCTSCLATARSSTRWSCCPPMSRPTPQAGGVPGQRRTPRGVAPISASSPASATGPGSLLRPSDDSVCRRLMNHTICLPR